MDELQTEVRKLRRAITWAGGVFVLQALIFGGMNVGIYTAANRAAPRLLRLRQENELLRRDNVALRERLQAAEKR